MTTSDRPTTSLSARNATLTDLVQLLRVQRDCKLDAVVPAQAIHAVNGVLAIDGCGAVGPGMFRPTEICDEHLAEKLQIPMKYLRRLRNERVDLYDSNINGWLQGTPDTSPDDPDNPGMVRLVLGSGPDGRSFLVRCFTNPDPDQEGICRAVLSRSYKMIDNYDFLMAALDGARQAV